MSDGLAVAYQCSPRRSGFNSGTYHVACVVDEVAPNRIWSEYLGLWKILSNDLITPEAGKKTRLSLKAKISKSNISFVMSVCPSVSTEQLGSKNTYFRKI